MSWSNDRTNFDRNIAVIIGINNYQNGIHPLSTPVNDATVLANILKTEYKYQKMVCLFPPYKEATLENINELLKETLPNQIRPTEGERLLFYFAGHGIARNSEDGPAGYLIPQDAQLGKLETFLPMRDLNSALSQLDCHHLLVILDCCFAGNFRWSSARNVIPVPETIHREHYDRFIRCSAWQAITSAAHNQEALDFLSDLRDRATNSHHSPFALALIEGLKDNKADLTGDGVITAPELYLYLRDRLIGKDGISELQTPGLWPLQKHDRGEFIFTLPGFEREQLTPAPPLNKDNNPYRGLQPFDEKHARFFFGRQELIKELYTRISQSEQSSSQLIVVVGISGSGKSSLVKAGLIPHLRKNYAQEWHILKPMRPGKSPFIALATTLLAITNVSSDAASKYVKQLIRNLKKGESQEIINAIAAWSQANPQVKLLLTIDQFEELITMSRKPIPISPDIEPDSNEQKPQRWLSSVFRRQSKAKNNERPEQKDDVQQEWQQFLALLTNTLKHCPQLHIVLTLRSDFEARFVESAFQDYWDKARFPVRAMRSDELREAIEKPASEMALYFEPANSVDRLIDEVGEMPGALPLLSFTLSEFYIKLYQAWVKDDKTDRALTVDEQFYQQGGIAGSLTYRANEIYDGLPDDAHKGTMRRVMLRMVEIQGREAVRRQVPESELVYADPEENQRREKVIQSRMALRKALS
ncbi:caspase family protein, partial [Brasilonema sp. UFV-L1]|uniref:nSTAND1 domain-containing NTPase n=1 Tax=Brasilonema sp. UFV-L1 TaxID=2234130 RepID=UPI0016B7BD62